MSGKKQKKGICKSTRLIHLFLVFILFSSVVNADSWTSANPSHSTLFTDTITSKTENSAVNIADSQGLLVTTNIISMGNVGIGTVNPQSKLHVKGTTDDQISLDGNSGGNIGLFFRENGASKWEMYHRGATSDFRIYSYDFGNAVMTLMNNGNVGIGTTNPSQKLTIEGISGGGILVKRTGLSSGGLFAGSSGGEGLALFSTNVGSSNIFIKTGVTSENGDPFGSGSTRLFIDGTSGNIGISTSSNINSKLVVSGTAVGTANTYTANGVTNGNLFLTLDSGAYGTAGLVGTGGSSGMAIKVNPLGISYGSIGVVGAAHDNNGGGRNSIGVYGYSQFNAGGVNANGNNIQTAGLFISELSSAVTDFRATQYGVFARADASSATGTNAATQYGVYGRAIGRAIDTSIGGYFTASGGASNYAGIFDQGFVGIGTTNPSARLHLKGSGVPLAVVENTQSGNYGLIEFRENGVQKAYLGMGGSTQTFNADAAYSQDGFSINSDGAGAMEISNRGASKTIYLNTGSEGTADFHTVTIKNGKIGIGTTAPAQTFSVIGEQYMRSANSAANAAIEEKNGAILHSNTNWVTLLTITGGSHAVIEVEHWAGIGTPISAYRKKIVMTTSAKNRIDTLENYDGGLADSVQFQWSGNDFQVMDTDTSVGQNIRVKVIGFTNSPMTFSWGNGW